MEGRREEGGEGGVEGGQFLDAYEVFPSVATF